MSILLIILLVIVLLVACMLLIPIHISLELLKDGPSLRGFYRVQWMGIVFIQNEIPSIGPAGGGEDHGHGHEEDHGHERSVAKAEAAPDHESGASAASVLSKKNLELLKDALPSIASTIVDLIECISFRRLDLNVAFGMNDPSETAMLSGYIWSASAVLGGFWRHGMRHGINLVPDFRGQRLDGSIITEFRIRLLMVAAAVIRALSREPLRKLIESLVRDSLVAKPESS